MMICKEYFLARRDIVWESSSFCSIMSSAIRRMYLQDCKKTILSLYLSEWLEWSCRGESHSVNFLYRIVESFQSAAMYIFMSGKDIPWVECSKVNLIVGWRLFMESFMDWSCLVVPRKIRKMSSINIFQKWIAQIKASWMVSS